MAPANGFILFNFGKKETTMIQKLYFDGEAITAKGFLAEVFFIVQKGSVVVMSENSKSIKHIYYEGEIIGLAEVLKNTNWPFTSLARGETNLLIYQRQQLNKSLKNIDKPYLKLLDDLGQLALSA